MNRNENLRQAPQQVELLAPARNLETGIEALRHGADAVYIGGPAFGARSAAGNSVDDIRQLCEYAHTFGARVYVTINTILYDDEIPEVESLVRELYAVGVDALITQDLAFLTMDIPPIALHASTQMDNCTPERAQFLEAAGYSQIVMARELSLSQIRDIHEATSLPLEAFVHGALCVSYSGRCYASEYCFGRSANRGRCAQFCRLAFDLVDANGEVLEHDKHLLSLRDMNRSADLEAMLDAGVRSFKIEGRLKDVAYVKNVTARYRQALDEILQRRGDDYVRASRGASTYTFRPELRKSFNRGFTKYLLEGRTRDLWNFQTPKSMGEHIGVVSRLSSRALYYKGDVDVNNGDGLVFINAQGKLEGFRANRVEGREVFPLKMPAVTVGDILFRNEDRLWENLLAAKSAERKLPITIILSESEGHYTLTARVNPETQNVPVSPDAQQEFTMHFPIEVQRAAKPQAENIRQNLSKLGDTPFVATSVVIAFDYECFIPASVLAAMRREFAEALHLHLLQQHVEHRPQRREANEAATALDLSGTQLTYSANVANAQARKWLEDHGASRVEPAFEVRRPAEASLMTCRHCLRYALGQCPRETGKRPSWAEPLSLRLPEGRTFPLEFDCARCEMHVMMPRKIVK